MSTGHRFWSWYSRELSQWQVTETQDQTQLSNSNNNNNSNTSQLLSTSFCPRQCSKCYYAHFIDEETDDRKFVQGHMASKQHHWHSNIGNILTLVIGRVIG